MSNARTCGTCVSWAYGASKPHAKVGLAACALGPSWEFLGASKTCEKHQSAAVDVLRARLSEIDAVKVRQGGLFL